MKIKHLLFYIFIVSASFAAPAWGQKINNNFIDTINSPTKEIYRLWRAYITSKPGSFAASSYWDKVEAGKYKGYDLLYEWKCSGTYGEKSTLLKIRKIDSTLFELKIGMGFSEDVEGTNLISSLKFLVKKEDDTYKLANYLPSGTKKWRSIKPGNITFYYPMDVILNMIDAQKSERFLRKIFTAFSLPVRPVTYYVAPDCETIHAAIGLESFVDYNYTNTCTCFDVQNDIVYSAGKGFYNPPGLCNVIRLYYPNAHVLFMSGISALFGGYDGQPLKYHQKKVSDYLAEHPEKRAQDITGLWQSDQSAGLHSLAGAIFCLEAIKQGGNEKMKRLFIYGNNDTDFYTAIEKELGIAKNKVMPFFLEKLKDPTLFEKYPDF